MTDILDDGRHGGMEGDAREDLEPVPLPVQARNARRRDPCWIAVYAHMVSTVVGLAYKDGAEPDEDLVNAALYCARNMADAALDARDEA